MHTFSCHYNWLHHAKSLCKIIYYSFYQLLMLVLLHLTVHLCWQQRLFKGEVFLVAMNRLNEEQCAVQYCFDFSCKDYEKPWSVNQFSKLQSGENELNIRVIANLFSSTLRSTSPILGIFIYGKWKSRDWARIWEE